MKYIISLTIIFLLFASQYSSAQKPPSFTIIPLGTEGGLNEANLSCYLVAPFGSNHYISLDAGTLYAGVQKAITYKTITKPATAFIRQRIKAYCISHPHLDHVAGLIINSPSDTTKNIYGTKFCLDRMEQHYFSWQTWANFGDEGEKPTLNKYHYKELTEDSEVAIAGTELFVTAFILSHAAPYESTAFLIRKDKSYLLYFGDTGADTIEHSQRLYHIWQAIAPLIQKKQVKGIFIECSYPDEQPDKQLFGHLTPKLLMEEMKRLAAICGKNVLKNFPLVVTHLKPEGNNESKIVQQLKVSNSLGLRLVYPQQGKIILL